MARSLRLKSIRLDQADFFTQFRSALMRVLASSMSFRISAVRATFGGFPALGHLDFWLFLRRQSVWTIMTGVSRPSADGLLYRTRQIGKVEGIMEMCGDIEQFKDVVKRRKAVTVAPYLFDEMNKIIE
jgi:hypothetical protein